MKSTFSINDVTVIKGNDPLSNEEITRIIGGNAGLGSCACRCGTNSARLSSGSTEDTTTPISVM